MQRRFLLIFALLLGPAGSVAAGPELSDSLYNAHHPRILYETSDLPALRAKLMDGGRDDEAYAYICSLAVDVFPFLTPAEFVDRHDFALSDFLNVCIYAQVEEDAGTATLGKDAALYIARNWEPENAFYGSLRLRDMALAYDNCFGPATPAERDSVRVEMEAYIDSMLTSMDFELFKHRPFVSNITAMVGAAVGLAAIVLDGETDPARVAAGLARADEFVDTWQMYQLDPGGSYKEGVMYGSWSLRHLIPYFVARKRYDGTDYGSRPAIRDIEKWLAFELLPVASGQLNNLNDAACTNYPLSRHNTYLDWAQTEWGSGLSAWLWERLLGPVYGHSSGPLRDAGATALWSQSIPPVHPGTVLGKHAMWADRGFYTFRTGWQSGATSDDVLFTFISGKFHGGHTQEDDNSFTLYGFGERFAIDHGFFTPPQRSVAHNMTFIDGNGQHYSSSSFGTDGAIPEYLLGDFADYVKGDATQAYTTYSEFNEPDVPFPGYDWSYGYIGANPVLYAHRRIVVVHDDATPPYFFYVEDIRKDDAMHHYDWRMHTDDSHTLDMSMNPMRVTGSTGELTMHVLSPPFDSLATSTDTYDNGHSDPDATIMKLGVDAVAPSFIMLWFLGPAAAATPTVTHATFPWGEAAAVDLGSGVSDILAANRSGGSVSFSIDGSDITTDAAILVIRRDAGDVTRFLATGASTLVHNTQDILDAESGPLIISVDGDAVRLDRTDIPLRVYAPQATQVLNGDSTLVFARDGDYVLLDTASTTPTRPPSAALSMRAYPSPSTSGFTIDINAPERSDLSVSVYDVAGRLVATLWNAPVAQLNMTLEWHPGRDITSGVYFIRAHTAAAETARKVILVR